MSTAWSHLPNAVHIDRILASVKAHPDEWHAVSFAAWDAAWDQARGAAYGAAWQAAYDAAWQAARGAIAALVTWDHSAKYLDMSSDKLKVWAVLSEDPACVLLLPAVIAFEKINELEVV